VPLPEFRFHLIFCGVTVNCFLLRCIGFVFFISFIAKSAVLLIDMNILSKNKNNNVYNVNPNVYNLNINIISEVLNC